ncbi:YeeE/YedE family protein [Ensifer sp. HO-A22]|uniref:YeeE/YedE family protein n=1 Tax=Ensifer oleiphilus TaxID=2742698 RepID=A0A7Y6QC07_9HYPH|nr:YeeE/YedE thiosulfate transporter family protein [Ensifer oleiphilus]NVD42878.1 YeeE/YedE family protein [Ensifer oleiphilus]
MNRSSICTVTAANDLVIARKPARLIALFECAVWAALVYTLLEKAPTIREGWLDVGLIIPAAFLLGVGTYANGACIFGSVGHLGDGDVAFAFTFIGILVAIHVEAFFGLISDQPAVSSAPPLGSLHLALLLALMLLLRLLLGGHKHPEFRRLSWSMASVGITSTALASIASGFSITTSVGSTTSIPYAGVAISLCMVVGSFVSARIKRRRIMLNWPDSETMLRKTGSGILMGSGALLIPGGNDTLLLVGLPMGAWQAAIAYIFFVATVSVLIGARRTKQV